jgi:hypothetical protein
MRVSNDDGLYSFHFKDYTKTKKKGAHAPEQHHDPPPKAIVTGT